MEIEILSHSKPAGLVHERFRELSSLKFSLKSVPLSAVTVF